MRDQITSEGLTFDQLRKNSIDLTKYLLSKWKWFLLIGILGGLLGIGYAIITKPKYKGKLTFVLAGDSKRTGLSGLVSQIGIDLGDNPEAAFSGDNIIELFRSRKIIERTLVRKMPDINKTLLNYYVEQNEINETWISRDRLKTAYPFPDSANDFTSVQDSLVRDIVDRIRNENLSVSRIDKKLIVYDVETVAGDELFATYLTKYLTDETAKFYFEIKTKSARENLAMIKREADSLASLLGGTIRYSASETDRTLDLNPALQIQRSSSMFAQSRITVLGLAYGEVIKNLEIAKINLQRETPLFQIIDSPTLPLKRQKPGKLKSAIIFSFFALFAGVFFFIITRKSK